MISTETYPAALTSSAIFYKTPQCIKNNSIDAYYLKAKGSCSGYSSSCVSSWAECVRAFRYLEVKSDFKCIVDETTKQSCGTEGPRAGTICLRVDSDGNYPVLGRSRFSISM